MELRLKIIHSPKIIQSLLIEQNVDEYASIIFTFRQIKKFATVKEVQQTVIEKPADSYKRAWFTLPDSFKIPWTPCQTVLHFFGFLFTPVLMYRPSWICCYMKIGWFFNLGPHPTLHASWRRGWLSGCALGISWILMAACLLVILTTCEYPVCCWFPLSTLFPFWY